MWLDKANIGLMMIFNQADNALFVWVRASIHLCFGLWFQRGLPTCVSCSADHAICLGIVSFRCTSDYWATWGPISRNNRHLDRWWPCNALYRYIRCKEWDHWGVWSFGVRRWRVVSQPQSALTNDKSCFPCVWVPIYQLVHAGQLVFGNRFRAWLVLFRCREWCLLLT